MGISVCPDCGERIAMADINMSEGVALCRACGKLSKLSEIAEEPVADPSSITRPPAGCSYDASPSATLVTASTRSIGGAIGTLAVCLFWNGIVSVFVLIVFAALFTHFVGPLPDWFPAPSSSGKDKSGPMPLGMAFFMCLFLTPFVVIGTGMFFAFLLSAAGRIDVMVSGSDGRMRIGVGPFGWTKRFDASQVKHVSLSQTKWQQNGQSKEVIEIDADRKVRFGSLLTDERREWMRMVLHIRLVRGAKVAKTSVPMRSPQLLD